MTREKRIDTDENVVCIVSGSGLKDIEHARSAVSSPLHIDPAIDAVRAALAHKEGA